MSPHPQFDNDFAELTARWNAHQELRSTGASPAELLASRVALDAARDRLRHEPIAA